MANIQLKPPEPFDFGKPDDWQRWKSRFEQFRQASGLSEAGDQRQVSTLLYCMGQEAEDVLRSTAITNAERAKYSDVLGKFDNFFKVRKNIIYERACFNRRNQGKHESVEQYIAALHRLVETCDYGELTQEMIRDRLVVGICDSRLSAQLQMDSKLDLETAMKRVRLSEAVKEQHQHLQEDSGSKMNPIVVDEVGSKATRGGAGAAGKFQRHPHKGAPRSGKASHKQAQQKCKRCGKNHQMGIIHCPAKDAHCYKCNRKGHFSAQCLSKSIAATTEQTTEEPFLGAIISTVTGDGAWLATVQVAGHPLHFKLDTGAEVTAISERAYKTLPQRTELKKPTKVLYGPTQQALKVLGQFTATLTHQGKTSEQTVYVVHSLQRNLLGLPAIRSLHLVSRIDTLDTSTEQGPQRSFPNLFRGLGNLGEPYRIQLKKDARPHAIFSARNVPIPLRDKVKQELSRMEAAGVISKVSQPTPWCAGMVVVPKSSGSIRICVDLKPLNESVLREVYPIPSVSHTLACLTGAQHFSKLDANSGFWQIPLDPDTRLLTTFLTPFGRYCFNKLPFGISSAPEVFQKRMLRVLEGLDGVLCHMDDVLVFGANQQEHDRRLTTILRQLQAAGVTLNAAKCEFNKDQVKFLGHIINKEGISADPSKTEAVRKMKPPQSVPELRRFLGMVNQLGQFSPRLAEVSQPLRELLSTRKAWLWGPDQDRAFEMVKQELSHPTVLALYNPRAKTKVSADASCHGLGAVLLQEIDSKWRPVAYASRAMTDTEKRYAQIEKEALACTWACDKFSDYLLGIHFLIESDHKPLIPLLGSKRLESLPPRVLRFRLRLARFDYSIIHVPGKFLYTADTLSRAPQQQQPDASSTELGKEVEAFVEGIASSLPATEQRLEEYRAAQEQDAECKKVREYCLTGWPEKKNVDKSLIPYWHVRNSLSIGNNILLYGSQIVVPRSLRAETLQKIHQGHQGIVKCRLRTRNSVWWPGVSSHIAQLVEKCPECTKTTIPRKEPLITSPVPDYPWQMVGTDLFELDGKQYLLVVDYLSRYPEVVKMTSSTTAASVISSLREIFARHGIPEILRCDNGPQYASSEMEQFAQQYKFKLITSSPRYPQSNGFIERMVKTVKQLLSQSSDTALALLSYRTTPLPWCNHSPAELSMGRCLRTSVPQIKEHFIPEWSYLPSIRRQEEAFKRKQKRDHDRRYRVKELPVLPDGSPVWMRTDKSAIPGKVVTKTDEPRSYLVKAKGGMFRRNRSHLGTAPKEVLTDDPVEDPQETRTIMTRSKTGTILRPPARFRELTD